LNTEKTAGNPEIPYDADVQRYNKKVEEFLKELKTRYPRNDPAELQELAEEKAAPYFFQNKETERPN